MNKFILPILVVLAIALCSGCGNSSLICAKGRVFNVSPQNGIIYVNGFLTVDVPRENVKTRIENEDNDQLPSACDDETKTASSKTVIEHETTKQVNGYVYKLSKESPKAVEAWLGAESAEEPQEEKKE